VHHFNAVVIIILCIYFWLIKFQNATNWNNYALMSEGIPGVVAGSYTQYYEE
jgi:hypothetical protein